MTKAIKPEVVVQVRREAYDGHIYSQVIKGEDIDKRFQRSLVIDRVHGRSMNPETVIMRAKHLASVLECPYDENLEWPCQAHKKLQCRCPACIKSGRA